MTELHLRTYLAPSLPLALFELIAARLGEAIGVRTRVSTDARSSGPMRGGPEPFSTGEVDLAFVCSPALLWMREISPPPIELVRAAPVFADARTGGQPVYFSDVIVARDSDARSFRELTGGSWAYNDLCSLSGYYCLLQKLSELGADEGFFAEIIDAGSHLASIDLVASGAVTAAAIDSNVLALALRRDPAIGAAIRVLESWGPFPIQPIIARSTLAPELRARVTEALLSMHAGADAELAAFGLERFAPVSESIYDAERPALVACERIARARPPARSVVNSAR